MAAESFVMQLIESLGSALAGEVAKAVCSPIKREALLSSEVHSRMGSIKGEFELMRSYLREVDNRRDDSQLVEAWARILQDLVYKVEDIVDEYTYLVGDQQRRGFLAFLHRTSSYYKNIKSWHSINSQLEEVNTRIINLASQKERYGIEDESTSSQAPETYRHHQDYSSYFLDEEEIVGFKKYRDLLIGWLTEEKPQRTIISVWGMGGLGKTTLAMDIYKSREVRRHFKCKAWVVISSMYKTVDLLRKIVKELFEENDEMLPQNIDGMSIKRLIETIRNFLLGERYLIVLDDVWDANAWFDIDTALLDSKCGSRVILTTRIHNVAMLALETRVLELVPLSESDSWLLFCKKAFWKDGDRICPQEVEYWARKITERCRGLPLAIVTIGRVVSTREQKEVEWRKVYEGLKWEMIQDSMSAMVRNVLSYSFKDLPHYMKNCFLYCSIFPEDHPIKRKRLIRLWVAEGLIRKVSERTMEVEAEVYLDELVHRCLLQVSKRNYFGRVKLCRMHDVIRELTLSICQRANFCRVYVNEEDDSIGEARRLSVQKGSGNLQSGNVSCTRSFFLFDTKKMSLLNSVSTSFRLLRVLDLEGVPIESIPKEVTGLFNLHYLGLRKTQVRDLPKGMGRLQNLETLDLYDSSIERLPHGVTKLKKLRHLFVEKIRDQTYAEIGSDPGVKSPKGIWNLTSLQTLQSTQADEEIVRNMRGMVQLRTLRITKVRAKHCGDLCYSLLNMSHLENLDIAASNETEALQLEELEAIACRMQKLELRAPLENGVVPKWFKSLTNLRHLGLSWSGLHEDPLASLASLPYLAVLGLYKAYDGQNLCFKAGGFKKLNMLMLGGSTNLDSVIIEEGAMPGLRELCLLRCSGMRLLPTGIEHLKALQEMYLLEMPEEFIEKFHRGSSDNEDEDVLQKVKHIHTIKHVFQRDSRWVSEILSR
ncbi:uncharacterized protein A4U43_C04F9580 [Asparagus officinalis]|uniref:Disease resistance protein RPM1-like n=1 Tax=Asparagus officinalis TaxID=4686 RepID=A0A5P1F426_ASPOF|nr:disease resistance protein RPM1-like [Asparagus officinalis]ONK71529.1 uncharacterized protein A4U43_C04F9580 [Asparagus officinalis]